MANNNSHAFLLWFVVILLIIGLFLGGDWFNYGVALSLIYIMFRTPMEYARSKK
ncbi:MAG: hypothetical protein ABIA93_01050 [Candidatus Woesearchaeota archaeon]